MWHRPKATSNCHDVPKELKEAIVSRVVRHLLHLDPEKSIELPSRQRWHCGGA